MKIELNYVKKKKSEDDKILEEVGTLLFPPLKTYTDKEGRKFQIDSSVDVNLEAALADLEEDRNDEVSRKTIKKVINKLIDVRKLLQANQKFDPDTQYILIDDPENEDKLSEIQIGE